MGEVTASPCHKGNIQIGSIQNILSQGDDRIGMAIADKEKGGLAWVTYCATLLPLAIRAGRGHRLMKTIDRIDWRAGDFLHIAGAVKGNIPSSHEEQRLERTLEARQQSSGSQGEKGIDQDG